MQIEFGGKIVAISGATGGIGRATAERFREAGARLVLIDMDAAALDGLRATLDPEAVTIVCDQRDNAAIQHAVAVAGPVDIFVNAAGIILRKPLAEMSFDEIDRILAVNLAGAIKMATGMAGGMLQRRSGVVVNLASQHAFIGAANRAVYAASKAGIVQFTKTAAVEWAPHGVRVVALAPGPVELPMTAEAMQSPDYVSAVLARMPIGRFLNTAEMAEIILLLCAPQMKSVTGHTLLADGGGALS